MVIVVPTWCGRPEEGETQLARFSRIGTPLFDTVETTPYGTSLAAFDKFLVNGQRNVMETCWFPALDSRAVDAIIRAAETAISPGRALITHEFRGAAARVPRMRRPSACAGTRCSSKFSKVAPTFRTRLRSSGIGCGRGLRAMPLTRSRFPAGIRIFSPATKIRNVSREATVAMRSG